MVILKDKPQGREWRREPGQVRKEAAVTILFCDVFAALLFSLGALALSLSLIPAENLLGIYFGLA